MTKEIRKIGVAGEGKMGSSIFLYLIDFDFRLTWLCSSEPESEKARKTLMKKLRLLFQCGVLTEREYASKSENAKVTYLAEDLKDCDLIIEAITEDIEIKKALFDSLDKTVNQECLFASNSSSLVPSEIILSGKRLHRAAGLHFFFPVALKKTVELITGSNTLRETAELLNHLLIKINKKPFPQDESNAFILNRLLLKFQAEAFNILGEGLLSVREIDDLVKQNFFPIGVFEFFDHVGIDIMYSSIRSYTRNIPDKEFYLPLLKKLEEMVRLNKLGIKTKSGFYNYSPHEKSDTTISDPLNDFSGYRVNAAELLWGCYIQSVNTVIQSSLCSRDELAFFVKDYLGMDTDPFTLSV